MSTSTQAMNNIGKVQVSATSNKTVADKKSTDMQFEALFSSAMGQIAPNAQLNSIESQLRESLFKQDKPRKDTDSNVNAEAAQAAVWAQRNWMQQASAPAPHAQSLSVSSSISNSISNSKQATAAVPADKAEAANSQNANTKAENKSAPAEQASTEASAKPAGEATENKVSDQEASAQPASNGPANSPDNTATGQQANATASTSESALTAAKSTDTSGLIPGTTSTASPAIAQGSSQATGAPVTQAADNSGQARDTGNAQMDAVRNAGTISKAGDTSSASSTNTMSAGSNASAVAAQLAPQIAQQTQGAQAELEVGELKAGQKILAASNLQATANPNAIATGTNGLTGPSGAAQQALIKTPVNQPGFAKELGQTVQWAIGKNMSTVDIRVNPESFGPMNMRLVQKGQQVQLVIRTQDEASANLLTQSLSNLKEVLAQTGLQLNQVQIQHGNTPNAGQGQNQQSQAQFDQNSGQHGRGGRQSTPGGTASDDHGPSATPTSASKPAGKLDMFA